MAARLKILAQLKVKNLTVIIFWSLQTGNERPSVADPYNLARSKSESESFSSDPDPTSLGDFTVKMKFNKPTGYK